jgi:hypothetical protein
MQESWYGLAWIGEVPQWGVGGLENRLDVLGIERLHVYGIT